MAIPCFPGLEYVIEFQKKNPILEPRYHCNLCDNKCDPRTLIFHVVGLKHRMNYLVR